MSSSKPVLSVSRDVQPKPQNQHDQKQQHFGFGSARRLDKPGFANILTPTKEVRVASLARRGFAKMQLSQTQFILREPITAEQTAIVDGVKSDHPQNINSRMGAVAPKRLLKRAVLRNRAKRIMRETARQHLLMAESADFIVFLREKAPLKNKVGRKQFAQDVKANLDRTLELVKSAQKRFQRAPLNAPISNTAESA